MIFFSCSIIIIIIIIIRAYREILDDDYNSKFAH